jgi:hypothetical protein
MSIITSVSAEHGNSFRGSARNSNALEVQMRKLISAGLAALTIAGGAVATTTPVQAAPHGGFGGGFHGGGFHGGGFRGGFRGGGFRGGAFLGAGLLGFGLGAALAGPYYGYGYGYPYDYGYYGPDYGPGPYGACVSNRQVWDPYYHRYVVERVRYAC